MSNRADYLEQASRCFNTIADILGSSDLAFWHVGRTLETCNDYIAQNRTDKPIDAARFRDQVSPWCRSFYREKAGNPDNQAWWWDDYGWWGLAHLAVGDLQNAKDCWQRMKTYGVERGPRGGDYWGGCWNHTIDQNPPGCENSVTGSTFFLLSLRLLNAASFNADPMRNDVLGAARNWASWFDRWLGRSGALLNPIHLVRERPVGDEGGYFPKGQPNYEVGCIWTGDQGLALAWAAEAFQLAPTDGQGVFPGAPYRDKAFQMANLIRRGMETLFDADGVLHEAPYASNSWGGYNIDYATGRGVFMRCLSRADRVFRNQPGWLPSDERVQQTADAVIELLGTPSPTMYSWKYGTEQDVLNAWTSRVSGPTEGTPRLCNSASLSTANAERLVFYGIALDALTAATVVTP